MLKGLAMKLGAYDYLTKPFNMDDLIMKVERALERRRLVLESREYQLRLEQKVERQAGQIQQYYSEATEALVREQEALAELEATRRPRKGLARKLSQILGVGTPHSSGEKSGAAHTQTGAASREAHDQPPEGHEEEA